MGGVAEVRVDKERLNIHAWSMSGFLVWPMCVAFVPLYMWAFGHAFACKCTFGSSMCGKTSVLLIGTGVGRRSNGPRKGVAKLLVLKTLNFPAVVTN